MTVSPYNQLIPGKLYYVTWSGFQVYSDDKPQTSQFLELNKPYFLTKIVLWPGDSAGARYYFLIGKKEYEKYIHNDDLCVYHEWED